MLIREVKTEILIIVREMDVQIGYSGYLLPAKAAGGDLNFAQADDFLLVMAVSGPASLFQQSKAQPGFVSDAVSGVGDEAFNGPKGGTP